MIRCKIVKIGNQDNHNKLTIGNKNKYMWIYYPDEIDIIFDILKVRRVFEEIGGLFVCGKLYNTFDEYIEDVEK